jgi:hypothetical protein
VYAKDLGIAADCSQRVCGTGRSWNSLPTSVASVPEAECFGRGVCNRASGVCTCRAGFGGASCEFSSCQDDCSGHGVCLPMSMLAKRADTLPLSVLADTVAYGFSEVNAVGLAKVMDGGSRCRSSMASHLQRAPHLVLLTAQSRSTMGSSLRLCGVLMVCLSD